MLRITIDLILLLLCSFIMSRAFHEWLEYKDTIMKQTVWYLLFPSYLVLLLFGVVHLFLATPNTIILFLRDIGFSLFIYTGILNGILLLVLKKGINAGKVET